VQPDHHRTKKKPGQMTGLENPQCVEHSYFRDRITFPAASR
jgi:hypothetical protein